MSQELDKHHIYYHPLPDSDLHNERGAETPKHKPEQRSRRFNRYALAGAVLASTNSILLGYGEH